MVRAPELQLAQGYIVARSPVQLVPTALFTRQHTLSATLGTPSFKVLVFASIWASRTFVRTT
jgi:hypothetical protein